MKLNVFKIPKDRMRDLKDKFKTPSLGLKIINSQTIGKYQADFYFSKDVKNIPIPWVDTYAEFFDDPKPANKVYFGCYLWESDKFCFALSYGKCHFYLRQFCDNEFGTHIAKRIANEKDIRQKSSKKFAGKKKKEIRSYTKNSQLDIESGESVDYLQASIIKDQVINFGKSGKFGSSVLLSKDMEKDKLSDFFKDLVSAIDLPENFPLPRTTIIDNTAQSKKYEEDLINKIITDSGETDFTSNSHDLFGVDFVFSGHEKYKFSHRGNESSNLDELSIGALRQYIKEQSIPKEEVTAIRVIVEKEDIKSHTQQIKDSLDYIVDGQNVILSQGRWMEFNEDYLTQLNEYIDSIDLEKVENDLVEITGIEGDFNTSLKKYGYDVADKDFSKIKIKSGTPVEAWDARKGDTVYALKFGTTQKLGYVCDQASNTLELINKKANTKKLDKDFKNYCIWLGMDNKNIPKKISQINSIILKQKIESWARKCLEFGITPKIKISKHVKVVDSGSIASLPVSSIN